MMRIAALPVVDDSGGQDEKRGLGIGREEGDNPTIGTASNRRGRGRRDWRGLKMVRREVNGGV